MVFGFVFWAIAALVSQVQSQQCNCPNIGIPAPTLPVPVTTPILPAPIQTPINVLYPQSFIAPPPVISTTVIDNSVANSLANALQLLIVSELIGNSINTPVYPSPYLPPLLDTVDIVAPAVDIAYAPVEIAPVNYGPIVEVSPNVVTEVITPTVTNIVPTVYGEVTEIVSAPIGIPEVISPGIFGPNIYAPVTEVIAPIAPITEVITPVTSTVTTNIYGGVTEVNPLLVQEYAPAPSIDVYTSITEVVNPVAPTVPINPYYGLLEVPPFKPGYVTEVTEFVGPREIVKPISPCYGAYATEEFLYPREIVKPFPPCYGGYATEVTEVVGPREISIPSYYGGYTELLSPFPSGIPFAAEVIFPQSIPAQLKCNFGYSPSSVPLVNVETVPVVEPNPYFY